MSWPQTGASMNAAYNSEDCTILAKALDLAWEIFLKAKRLTSQNHHIAKGALSFAILDAAESGERNPRRLAIVAVARMAKYEAGIIAHRSLFRGSAAVRRENRRGCDLSVSAE
jgi:hypothetical protein